MAELSLSQLIQESLHSDYISEEEGEKKEPGFFKKAGDKVKEGGSYIHGKSGELGGWLGSKIKGDAADDSLRGKIGSHIQRNKHSYGYGAAGAGALATAGAGYGLYKGAKSLLSKKSLADKATSYVKKNPGKAAGASLAALGAGAGAAALIRYLRKKRKNG